MLENKYYLDWFNENILARGARALGTGLWKGGDQAVIDGTLVNGSWKVVGWISGVVRKLQSGMLYDYALGDDHGHFCAHDVFRIAKQMTMNVRDSASALSPTD